MEVALKIDARDLLCPLPVLKLRKALRGLSPGDVLEIVTTDPVAVIDVPHACMEDGCTMISEGPTGEAGTHRFLIRKG